MKNFLTYLILHNIRSLYNLGAILRTAEGAGVVRVFLTGYTPRPFDRFGKSRNEVSNTALGAEKLVASVKYSDIYKLINKLKKDAIFIVVLEQHKKAVSYKNFAKIYGRELKDKRGLALILGNEVRGLSGAVLNQSNAIIEIPMFGKKESLNVSVAAGIALFELLNGVSERS